MFKLNIMSEIIYDLKSIFLIKIWFANLTSKFVLENEKNYENL